MSYNGPDLSRRYDESKSDRGRAGDISIAAARQRLSYTVSRPDNVGGPRWDAIVKRYGKGS